MPWLEGASLAARLADGQQFGVPEALWIARQTAEALDALHAAGWMHGDVTPGNIHVSPTGHVTLLDLNFARRSDEIGSAVDRPIMGTCSYLAPEYLTSALRPDIRSDIYSLGVVLFEMSFGASAVLRARRWRNWRRSTGRRRRPIWPGWRRTCRARWFNWCGR